MQDVEDGDDIGRRTGSKDASDNKQRAKEMKDPFKL